MNARTKKTAASPFGILSVLILLGLPAAAYPAQPVHLAWAESIAVNVTPDRNVYGSDPSYIYWAGVNGAAGYENRTQCSSFATRVLKQAYSWSDSTFQAWMGSKSPTAAKYHDTIQAGNGFSLVQNIADIQPGDILAAKYPEGSSSTGHVMMAYGQAQPRTAAAPLVTGTFQYELLVIDSSQSGHGPNDTRRMPDGSWDTGVGIGTLRLYADNAGSITGYTWSTYSNSVYYDQATRNLVVGRLP
jgi:hypothetical protein